MSSGPRFPVPRRWWWPWKHHRPSTPALILDETVSALGPSTICEPDAGRSPTGQTVPIAAVAGTIARAGDFDRELRPTGEHLRERWERVAALVDAGTPLPPVSLVRVGELYFIADGHHRISIAKVRGQLAVDAQVRALCTIAFACRCLTHRHLALKAAERDFLTTVPLPGPATRELWLDDPRDYQRLATAAHTWANDHDIAGHGRLDPAAATAWWQQHVLPLADTHREAGSIGTAAAYLLATGEST